MASLAEVGKSLYHYRKPTRWTKGIGASLPEEYKKFWKEWKIDRPDPVHYIPKEGKYELAKDGTILPIQNIALPLKYPKESNTGIWGGEAVIQGFYKKSKFVRRHVRYWVPQLKKSILYSEILDKYMRIIVTNRTLNLVHENFGFDHYLLKTKACNLQSLLAVQLKREMLINLADKTLYPNDPIKREEVFAKYEHYLQLYTRKEIEWYGLSYQQACIKIHRIQVADYKPQPLKLQYREELIRQLRQENTEETKSTWLSRMNPFNSDK